MRHVAALLLAFALSACGAVTYPAGSPDQTPRVADDVLIMADGARLPLRSWPVTSGPVTSGPVTSGPVTSGPVTGAPKAVVLALHGMNDYSNFFAEPAARLGGHGIAAYAYDQRGFGRAPHPGYWSSTEAMVADARAAVDALAARHPGVPFFLFGESMGGAVAMLSAAEPPAALSGIIVAAPAVWGRSSMPWWQRLALWLAYHTAPGWTPSGRGLNIMPSDNIEMLRRLGADPLVIKRTRIDAVKGLVDLMDAAEAGPAAIRVPVLFLYGAHDELIPPPPVWRAAEAIPRRRAVFYPDGWHMLVRDLQAAVVLDDMAAWMIDPAGALPSGAEALAPVAAKE